MWAYNGMYGQEFLSTPSARRATLVCGCIAAGQKFLSTPSARRATAMLHQVDTAHDDFYPRPPRGGRLGKIHRPGHASPFLSTPSARRATRGKEPNPWHDQNFYPRPPRGGRPRPPWGIPTTSNFYPRPPRGGRRPGRSPGAGQSIFLSTPSARRATADRPH